MIVVAICTFITGLYQQIASGGAVNWVTIKHLVIAAPGSAISYLTKNLLSNSKGDFLKAETIKTEIYKSFIPVFDLQSEIYQGPIKDF